jgi:MFS transporter, PPP family, 3-phenylpropionic acid transporter
MEAARRAQAFAIRVAVFYGALFVVYGMHVPYTPVWLDGRGLSAAEISTVMAAPFFLRLLITPGIAMVADRTGRHRHMVIVLSWASLAVVLLLSQAIGFRPILLLTVPLIVAFTTIMPLTETVAVSGVRHAGLDYGRMRLWGSLTFLAASFAGGFAVAHWGSGVGIWLVALGCVLTVFAAHLLPREALATDAPDAERAPWWKAEEPRMLLRQPAFLAFLVAAGGVQAAHATFLTFGTLIWQKQGLTGGWIGALWAIGVFAEVALFSVSAWLVETFGVAALLMAGAGASILRWTVMAFSPGLAVLIPLQILHGVTYGASHIGAIHFIGKAVPLRAAGSAQALYATVAAGLAMGIATLIAGWLYASIGGVSYFAMTGIAAIAFAAAVRLGKVWTGSEMIDVRGNSGAALP